MRSVTEKKRLFCVPLHLEVFSESLLWKQSHGLVVGFEAAVPLALLPINPSLSSRACVKVCKSTTAQFCLNHCRFQGSILDPVGATDTFSLQSAQRTGISICAKGARVAAVLVVGHKRLQMITHVTSGLVTFFSLWRIMRNDLLYPSISFTSVQEDVTKLIWHIFNVKG